MAIPAAPEEEMNCLRFTWIPFYPKSSLPKTVSTNQSSARAFTPLRLAEYHGGARGQRQDSFQESARSHEIPHLCTDIYIIFEADVQARASATAAHFT